MRPRVMVLFVCIGFCCLILSWEGYTMYYYGYYPSPPAYYDPSRVEMTKEYQITLKSLEWTNRSAALEIWEAKINEVFPLFDLSIKTRTHRIYSQQNLETEGSSYCEADHKMHVRVRKHRWGEHAGTSSVDVKYSGYYCDNIPLPFWPAEKYVKNSTQKCEHDVHPCFSKRSRVSKVIFPDFRHMNRCSDLMDAFPDVFYTLPESKRDNLMPIKALAFVSATEYQGFFPDGTKWKISFEMKYGTPLAAYQGTTTPVDGEFSIRIHALDPDVDYEEVWNTLLVSQLDIAYYQLVMAFDKFPHHIECAKKFFRTGKQNKPWFREISVHWWRWF